jgi:hypothetical protein
MGKTFGRSLLMLLLLRNGGSGAAGNADCQPPPASKFLNTTFNDAANSYLFTGM